jgi:putative ABC transport system permease protein
MKFLPLILRNAWRNRRRTTLTVVSIGISMCLLGMLMAIYHAFYIADPPPGQALRLVTRHRVSLTFPLPEAYADRLRHVPGVSGVVIRSWFGGVYKNARDTKNFFARFACEPERLFQVYTDLNVPDDQKKAFLGERSACIIGRELAERLNFHLGDRITLMGDIYPVNLELTVRGIMDNELQGGTLYFNREYLEQSLPLARRGTAGLFTILCESTDAVPRVARIIDDQYRNSQYETKTESEAAFALGFVNSMGNVKLFLLSICGAVTFTILLVAGNTMAMTVRERVRETGILKTIGFTPARILTILLGESLAIAVAGGVLGYMLGSGLCVMIRQNAPVMFSQIKHLTLGPFVAEICFAVALAIGLLSSLLPAWRASRISIVEALRSTD